MRKQILEMTRYALSIVPILLIALLLVMPILVSAHATPITHTPESGAVVVEIPSEIQIYFTERIEDASSGIKIFAPDGSEVQSGTAFHGDDRRHYNIGLDTTNLQETDGVYTVSWQVVSSDDGHFTKGAFAFAVGDDVAGFSDLGSSVGQIQIQHVTTIPEASFSLINLFGQSIIIGSLLVFAFVVRKLKIKNSEIRAKIHKRFILLTLLGALLSIFGTATYIVIKTFDLQQLRGTDFMTTLQVFLEGNAGSFALGRILLVVVLVVAFLFLRKKIIESYTWTRSETFLVILVFAMMYLQSKVSHAAASHFLPETSIFMTAFHLFFKEFLVGGAIAFLLIIFPFVKELSFRQLYISALRYSRVATVAIGVAGATGIYITWLHLKDVSNLITSEWGGRFLLLLFFGILLGLVRLLNQVVVEFFAKTRYVLLQWTKPLLSLEIFLGIVVLFFSGYLSITTPPFLVEEYSYQNIQVVDNTFVSISPDVHESGVLRISSFFDQYKQIPPDNLIVSITNNEKNIGPIVVELDEKADGIYTMDQSLLAPPGEWEIRVVTQRDGEYDVITKHALDYPNDILESRKDTEIRYFDSLAKGMLVLLVSLLVLTIFLYLWTNKLLRHALGKEDDNIHIQPGRSLHNFVVPFVLFIILLFFSWFINEGLFKSTFQQVCESDGHFWIQSAAMRNGETISPNTTTGCTLSVGLYHFATKAEYNHFFYNADDFSTAAELVQISDSLVAGEESTFELQLNRVEDGRIVGPITDLIIEHDRLIHMIVIGEDLQTFSHVHPEDMNTLTEENFDSGRFPISYTFPKAGRYTIVVDYVVQGREISEQFFVTVAGEDPLDSFVNDSNDIKTFGAYDISFEAEDEIMAGVETKISYTISKDGEEVTDLEPYLAASMHVAVIRSDLKEPTHTHGEVFIPGSAAFQELVRGYVEYHSHFVPTEFGPKVQARLTFPEPGTYMIFGEFSHDRDVIVTNFEVEVQ